MQRAVVTPLVPLDATVQATAPAENATGSNANRLGQEWAREGVEQLRRGELIER